MGFTLNPYLIARFGIKEIFKLPVGDSIGTETTLIKETHPSLHLTGECLSLHIIYFLFLHARIFFQYLLVIQKGPKLAISLSLVSHQ